MNVATWLARSGRTHPNRPAVALGRRVHHDYATLAGRAARLAGGLRRLGAAPGDRVALVARNRPEYLESLFGIWWAGLAAVPVNSKLHGTEIAWILEDAGASVCLATPAEAAAVDGHRPSGLQHLIELGSAEYEALLAGEGGEHAAADPDDLAWLFYTSGTTGRPKGAMITHRNLVAMSFGYLADVDPTAPTDAILHAAPMSHGSGLYALPHVCRAACNVVPESGGFDAEEVLRLLETHAGTSMFAAPTMIKRMVESRADLGAPGLRTLVWGGAPMYVEDVRRTLERFGPRLAQIFGQGESPMTGTVLARDVVADREHPRWLERIASAGIASPACEIRVADAEDGPLPAGEIGEILIRGDCVMAGYWRQPEATAETLRGGWLHTGDVGVLDADGFLTLKDRSKDLILSGGSNVYPREVEEVLLTHPGVREISVIGRPHPEWGEVVVAYVVGEVAAEELDRLCLARIARFKRPKDYVFVDALPKNNYGKILKTELRARDGDRRGSG